MDNIKLFKPADAGLMIIIAVTAALFTYFWFFTGENTKLTAVIEKDGEIVREIGLYSLTEPVEVELDGDIPVVIVAEPDGAYIAQSACSDKICVGTGKLTRAGQVSVCLPARVSLRLDSRTDTEHTVTDAVTG